MLFFFQKRPVVNLCILCLPSSYAMPNSWDWTPICDLWLLPQNFQFKTTKSKWLAKYLQVNVFPGFKTCFYWYAQLFLTNSPDFPWDNGLIPHLNTLLGSGRPWCSSLEKSDWPALYRMHSHLSGGQEYPNGDKIDSGQRRKTCSGQRAAQTGIQHICAWSLHCSCCMSFR